MIRYDKIRYFIERIIFCQNHADMVEFTQKKYVGQKVTKVKKKKCETKLLDKS